MQKSFILHLDSLEILDRLSNEQRGELLYAMVKYHKGEKLELSPMVDVVFFNFEKQFIRDREKYEKSCEKNRKNGEKGGRPREETETQNNPVGFSETQNNPLAPDSDSDSDSKNDSDSDLKEKNKKKKFGEYKHVLLTEEQLEKLKVKFPNSWVENISKLDIGIQMKGYKYKDHYLAILDWARRDEKENKKTETFPKIRQL